RSRGVLDEHDRRVAVDDHVVGARVGAATDERGDVLRPGVRAHGVHDRLDGVDRHHPGDRLAAGLVELAAHRRVLLEVRAGHPPTVRRATRTRRDAAPVTAAASSTTGAARAARTATWPGRPPTPRT